MIATASYYPNSTNDRIELTHSTTDDCTGSVTGEDRYTCTDATCNHYGTCTCIEVDYVTVREQKKEDVYISPDKLPFGNIPFPEPTLKPGAEIKTMFYMSHRTGSTNKKIKQWSGFIH